MLYKKIAFLYYIVVFLSHEFVASLLVEGPKIYLQSTLVSNPNKRMGAELFEGRSTFPLVIVGHVSLSENSMQTTLISILRVGIFKSKIANQLN